MKMAIDLYILRHAIAESRETWAPKSERERPLTRKGEKEMVRVAKGMKKLELSFDLILCSPFVRAKRTAEIVVDVFDIEERLKLSDTLTPQSDPKKFPGLMRRLFGSSREVLLVGHEPFLSELISLLICGDTRLHLKLKKAGLCKLTLNSAAPNGGALQWLLTPAQICRIR